MKVTLTKVTRTPRTSKSGKPFISLGIKTQENGEKWLSGFDNKATADWKEGDTVDIEVEQKGEYLNFSLPKLAPSGNLDLTKIESMLSDALNKIGGMRLDVSLMKDGMSKLNDRMASVERGMEYDNRTSDGAPEPTF